MQFAVTIAYLRVLRYVAMCFFIIQYNCVVLLSELFVSSRFIFTVGLSVFLINVLPCLKCLAMRSIKSGQCHFHILEIYSDICCTYLNVCEVPLVHDVIKAV